MQKTYGVPWNAENQVVRRLTERFYRNATFETTCKRIEEAMNHNSKQYSMQLFCLLSVSIMLLFSQGCSNTSDIVKSDPATLLAAVPGGYRYGHTSHTDPIIYQDPLTESTYKFQSCDTIIGQEAYAALKQFMLQNNIEKVIISEDHTIFLCMMPRVMDPNEVQGYVFHTDPKLSEDAVIENANALYFIQRPFTQWKVINENWMRVTPFDGRGKNEMGIFRFD